MIQLVVTQIGNSAGVILPKEALRKLDVAKGDTLFLVETSEGFLISAYDPEFEEAMAYVDEGMRQYRNTLKELAK
jgi:putative addiction module antidote